MYDLILRDATIVSSKGRVVADVCVHEGRIAYVGPNPPRRKGKEEMSAMGRFLMPGVVDTAVAFDPEADGSVWERESKAALTGGVTTVVALPTGRDAVVDRASAARRAERALGKSWTNFGLWGSLEADNAGELSAAAEEGLVLGALTYTGAEGADIAALEACAQFPGVLGVQIAGPEAAAAIGPVLLRLAREYERQLHLVHLSTAAELSLLDPVRGDLPVTAGVTPHHLFFAEESLNGLAGKLTTRPPVRAEQERRTLWTAVKRGRLDVVASDHQLDGGGAPGTEILFPLMLSAVKYGRLSLEMLVSLCSEAPARIFGLEGKGRIQAGADADLVLFTEGELTKVDEASLLSGAGWSPYIDRETAPKPEMVMIDGKIVARKGKLAADAPVGRLLRRGPTLAATGTARR